jgi:cysteine desulfurase
MIYFDYNATTPLDVRVLGKMLPYLKDNYGNPSSIYRFAQSVRNELDNARECVAELLSARADEIIFTSGGTEADNTAIKGVAFYWQNKGKHIVVSKIEHQAILNTCKFLESMGFSITYVNVDHYGVVDLEELKKSIRKDTILVSIIYANNETGVIQPIKEIANICKERGVYFHTDAIQAIGKIPIRVKDLGVDLLSLSGHKFYGPKGVGALYVKKVVKFYPLIHGGHHEKNRRAGTENVSGIVGLGQAARIARSEMLENKNKIELLCNRLEEGIKKKIPQIQINGHPQKKLYNTLNVSIKHIEGESALINLDFEGICASSGSACTSGSLGPSHVLLAMGLSRDDAYGSLRFSLGRFNTSKDVEKVLEVLPPIVEKLRKMSPSWQRKK